MKKILNVFFSSREDHAAVIYLHRNLSIELKENLNDIEVHNIVLTGDTKIWKNEDNVSATFLNGDRRSAKGKSLFGSLILVRSLKKAIQNTEYDLVITDGFSATTLIEKTKLKLIPSITIIHSKESVTRKKNELRKIFKSNKKTITTVSCHVKEYIQKLEICHQERIKTINNAINFELLNQKQKPREESRRKLNLNQSQFVIGTIGRLSAVKNQKVIIEALGLLKRKSLLPKSLVCIIIGKGKEEKVLHDLTNEEGLADQVIFTGSINHAPHLLKALDLFIFPSLEDEGFGLSLLEAVASKIPVLAQDSSSARLILQNHESLFSNNIELSQKITIAFHECNKIKCSRAEDEFRHAQAHFESKRYINDYIKLVLSKLNIE